MPDLVEQMFCSQQITIPPKLPTILKKYAKAAIRTQPKDLLVWSSTYFKALTYGIPLPIKERIEYPPVETISGLTPGFLKVLVNQMGNNITTVNTAEVADLWNGVCLSEEALQEIFAVGGFGLKLNWLKFIAICAGYLESCLTRTMILLCELLTEEPLGGSSHLPVNKFLYLYKYLARLECGPEEPKEPAVHPLIREKSDELESEALSGEGISYKGAEDESIRTRSAISWQSVLKRMGKRESDVSGSTIDPDKICNKDDYLSRGIAWERIKDIGESEPDTSMTQSDSLGEASSMGLQVFEHPGRDVEPRTIKRFTREGIEKAVTDDKSFEEISKSEALLDLTGDLGKASLQEILGFAQELETTTNIKTVGEAKSDEAVFELESLTSSPQEESHISDPSPDASQRLDDVVSDSDKADFQVNELLKADSSMILVPTPQRLESEEDSIDDIEELNKEEELSFGEPLATSFSLHDVRVPVIDIPPLIKLEDEELPMTFVQKQKWVYIPGIGPKIPEEQINQVENYMKECADKQAGTVMPRNLRHYLCPPLDLEPNLIKKYEVFKEN